MVVSQLQFCLALFSLCQLGRALFPMSSHLKLRQSPWRPQQVAWASPLILIQASTQCGNITSMCIPLAEADHIAQAHINEPCNMEFISSHCLFFSLKGSFPTKTKLLFFVILNSANS